MSQTIKKRLSRLRDLTTQSSSGIVFMTLLESGDYEVRYQNHAKGFTERIAVYQSEEEAQNAINKIVQDGDYIVFYDDIPLDD